MVVITFERSTVDESTACSFSAYIGTVASAAKASDDGKSNPNVIADTAAKLRIELSLLVVARSSSAPLLLVAPRLREGRDDVAVFGETTTNAFVAVDAAIANAKNLEKTIIGDNTRREAYAGEVPTEMEPIDNDYLNLIV